MKYIYRILLRLGFLRKTAKDIFIKASTRDNSYMCENISQILYLRYLRFGFGDCSNEKARYLRAYGFTYENYKKFIIKNYPSVQRFLTKGNYNKPWTKRPYRGNEPIIKESKNEFLKYLASRL